MDGGLCTGDRNHDHLPPKKSIKAKWLSKEALQIAVKTREAKSKGEKEKIFPFKYRVPKNSQER